ncbi:uncharacterized protein LOC118437350 [Folsomia candida]|nr:uncharacterized protein LOC118437350 [Folsomia candida]
MGSKKNLMKEVNKNHLPKSKRLKLQQAIEESARQEHKRRPRLRISRVVEQINQTKGDWRHEKSKLLFMLGLGLTPIPNSIAVIFPSILVPMTLLKSKSLSADSEKARYFKGKKLISAQRVRRFEILREWRLLVPPKIYGDVEVIDLTDDDDVDLIETFQSDSLVTSCFKNVQLQDPPPPPISNILISKVKKSRGFCDRYPLMQINTVLKCQKLNVKNSENVCK